MERAPRPRTGRRDRRPTTSGLSPAAAADASSVRWPPPPVRRPGPASRRPDGRSGWSCSPSGDRAGVPRHAGFRRSSPRARRAHAAAPMRAACSFRPAPASPPRCAPGTGAVRAPPITASGSTTRTVPCTGRSPARSNAAPAPAPQCAPASVLHDPDRAPNSKDPLTRVRGFTPAAPVVQFTLQAPPGRFWRPLSPYADRYTPETPWKSAHAVW